MSDETNVDSVPAPLAPRPVPTKNSFEDLLEAHGIDPLTGGMVEAEEEATEDVPPTKEPAKEPVKKALGKEDPLMNQAAKEVKGEEAKKNEELKTKQEAEAKASEALRFKDGDRDIDVPPTAKVSVQVNGKPVEVELATLSKAFTGQEEFRRNADARMHFITKKERAHAEEVTSIRTKLGEISEKAALGDMTAALKVMAEMTGKDPVAFEKELFDGMAEVIKVYTEMDDVQKDRYFAERRAEFLQEKLNKFEEGEKGKTIKAQLQAEVDTIKQEFGINDDEFRAFYQEMVDEGYDPKQVTPKDLKNYLLANIQYAKICEGIKIVDERLLGNEKLIDEVVRLTQNELDLSPEDIAEIIKDSIRRPTAEVQNLNRKLESNPKLRASVGHVSSNGTESNDDLGDYFLHRRA